MRVVFFGTPELAVPSLAACAERHDVLALVCQPDRPKGRGKKLTPPPAKVWAGEHGISVHQPRKLNDGSFEAWLRGLEPELCAIAAYGRLLKQPILDVPPRGWLNVHPSLLPKYRGPSPIRSAILNGEEVTGVTIMRPTLEMDAGDILLQEETPIHPDDTAVTLTGRLAEMGGRMLADGIDRVEQGTAVFTPQNHEAATYCSLFEKKDGRIDWTAPARSIHNLVRAALPWPVAHCLFRDQVYRIYGTELLNSGVTGAPGEIVEAGKDRLVTAAGEGALAVLELQAPGKRRMAVRDFLRGHKVEPGERFENIEPSPGKTA